MHFDTILRIIQKTGLFGASLLLFLESNPIIGSLIPGQLLIFAFCFLIKLGYFDVKIAFVVFFLSSYLGDVFNYYLGRKYARPLIEKYNLDKTQIYKKISKYLKKNLFVGLILGKNLNPTRAFAPFIAGKFKVNKIKFCLYSAFSTLIWVSFSMFLGLKFGEIILNNYEMYLKLTFTICLILASLIGTLIFMKIFYEKNYKFFRRYMIINYSTIIFLIFSIVIVNLVDFNPSFSFIFFDFLEVLLIFVFMIFTFFYVKRIKSSCSFFLPLYMVFFVFYWFFLKLIFAKLNIVTPLLIFSFIELIMYDIYVLTKNMFSFKKVFYVLLFFNFLIVSVFFLSGIPFKKMLISIIITSIFIEINKIIARLEFIKR